MRQLLAVLVLVMLLCAPSLGQTTQPVSATWTETAATIVDALTSQASDATPISLLIPDATTVQRFGSREVESSYRLLQQTRGMTAVSVRGYTWPAPTIASDLSADIKDSESLPAPIQKQFEIKDDADGRRANTTAAQWVLGALQPNTGELVAVVVLWSQPSAVASTDDSAAPDARQPCFILMKAHPVPGGFQVTQIAYGDARSALK